MAEDTETKKVFDAEAAASLMKDLRGSYASGRTMLGKSGIVFPKLTNVTIPMNSNFSGNTRQNTDTK